MGVRAVKRVYDGKYAIGVMLNDGRWYRDEELVKMMRCGVEILGLRINGRRLTGGDGINLYDLPRVNLIDSGSHIEKRNNTASIDEYNIERRITLGSSAGVLPKWVARTSSGMYYIKGRSSPNALEPEAEVCACQLAKIFGLEAVKYKLANIPSVSRQAVCISRDFSEQYKTMSLLRIVEISTGVKISGTQGQVKYKIVASVLREMDLVKHDNMLYFDYLIGNTDRHLRNIEVKIDSRGRLVGLAPAFDNGSSLFAKEPVDDIILACNSGNNFVTSRPYFSTHYKQVEELRKMGRNCSLKQVSRGEIYMTVNRVFGSIDKNRAKHLGQYVVQNAERLGLICQR